MRSDIVYYYLASFCSKGSEKMPDRSQRIYLYDKNKMDHINPETLKLFQKYQVDIRILATPNIDVSSHEIREWIRKANTSLKYYVPDKVISYIKEKNLYSECKE